MLERTGGIPVMMGSTAVDAAIKAYGGIRRIGIITPYMPVGDANVRRFFEDQGYEVVHLVGLKSPSPMLIAHETPQRLKQAAIDVSERSEEHTSELQSLMRNSYAGFCLKKKK